MAVETSECDYPSTLLKMGLFELLDIDAAVAKISARALRFPGLEDVHIWERYPGEPLSSAHQRLEHFIVKVAPRVNEIVRVGNWERRRQRRSDRLMRNPLGATRRNVEASPNDTLTSKLQRCSMCRGRIGGDVVGSRRNSPSEGSTNVGHEVAFLPGGRCTDTPLMQPITPNPTGGKR